MVTVASFKIKFPEFTDVPNAQAQAFLDDVLATECRGFWHQLYNQAVEFSLASKLFQQRISADGAAGPVTQIDTPKHSVSYSRTDNNRRNPTGNPYRQQYLELRDRVAGRTMFALGGRYV